MARKGFLCKAAALGVLLPVLGLPLEALAKPKKTVLGFYASWAPPSVRYDKITHLMYAFLNPGAGGQISGSVPGDLISSAHGAGVKIIASIGGANNSSGYPSLASSASGRSAFAGACKAITDAGADGVDIDWEFPANAGDSTNFSLLLKAIRASIGPSKLITLELAPNDEKGHWIPKSALDIADFYTAMAFDFTGDFPGSPVGQHSSYQASVIAINYWWKNRGVAREKVIMGVPFYGKNFDAGGASVDYKDIVNANPGLSADADQVGRTWFNGPTTMKMKATFVAQNSYGGVMVWQLAGDASPGSKSLLDALNTGLEAPAAAKVSRETEGRLSIRPLGNRGTLARLGMPGLESGLQRNMQVSSVRDISGRGQGSTAGTGIPAPAAGIYFLETRPTGAGMAPGLNQ